MRARLVDKGVVYLNLIVDFQNGERNMVGEEYCRDDTEGRPPKSIEACRSQEERNLECSLGMHLRPHLAPTGALHGEGVRIPNPFDEIFFSKEVHWSV